MNLTLLDVVISAAVSSTFALVVYRVQRNGDFRRDYMKTILPKRIDAHQRIAAIIARISNLAETEGGKTVLSIYVSESEEEKKARRFFLLLNELYDIWDDSIWISDQLLTHCRELYHVLYTDYVNIREVFGTPECEQVGVESYNRIYIRLQEIQNIILSEFERMNDLDDFLIKKRGGFILRLMKARESKI